jgi:hypothetical protein
MAPTKDSVVGNIPVMLRKMETPKIMSAKLTLEKTPT